MDILYVVLLFLQKKNKKELLCRNCGGNAGFPDGMADAYRKRLDAVLDSLYDHCNWNDVSVFMDGHRGYLENGSILLHESVSDGRIYGFPGMAAGIFCLQGKD